MMSKLPRLAETHVTREWTGFVCWWAEAALHNYRWAVDVGRWDAAKVRLYVITYHHQEPRPWVYVVLYDCPLDRCRVQYLVPHLERAKLISVATLEELSARYAPDLGSLGYKE
jgi:hypothetical protein